ncbi:MAG: c-type cytochrome domain-containing protein [Planctomycetota bacterium]
MFPVDCRFAIFFFPFLAVSSVWAGESQQTPVTFAEHVAPLLQVHCVACHGAKRAEGGYRLDTIGQMMRTGEGGTAPVVASQSKESEWIVRLRAHDPDVRMPAESEPLDPVQIETIARWIDEGAKLDGVSLTDPLWLVMPPKQYAAPPERYPNAFPISSLAFTADGSQILTSGYHELLVWNTSDGMLQRRIGNQVERIHSIAVLPQANAFLVAGGSPGTLGEVRWVDAATGMVVRTLVRANDVVLDLAVRPGRNEVAVAIADNTIRLIDLDRFEQRQLIASHADWVTQLAYSDDGKRLGSSSRDKSAKIYDADSGELLVSYPGHSAAVRGVAAIGDGAQWMTVGSDNKWHRWELEGAKKVAEIPLGGEPAKIQRAVGGLVIPCSDGQWKKMDVEKNALSLQLPGHTGWVTSIAVHSESGRVATGSLNGEVRIWNLADGALIHSFSARP